MAARTASIAKITRPLLTGSYPRKRLFRLIDRARRRPVLWVSGPAGSGKTTLVSSYVAARRLPVLWFRLGEGDADPATFFHYLGLAAKQAVPRVRKPLPVLTPDQHAAVPVFAQRYFEGLFARLATGSVIVFDDYHRIASGSAFHAMFREVLSLVPPGINIVLISRGPSPPVFARLRADRVLAMIGWKELRLSPRETAGIARLRWKGKIGPAAIRNVHDATGGWVAGFVLLLERAVPGAIERRRLPRAKPREVFDYFGAEILAGLDDEIQAFLLKSANLPRMTARMAVRLTGLARAGQILSYLNRHNYFTEVRPEPEPVYEYHPLFRDFLISRAGDLFSAKYIHRIRGKAAAVLEEAGYVEEAARLFREVGDFRAFGRILLRQAPALVREGRIGTLAQWLGSLPAEICDGDPWLLYWRGVCRLPSQPAESRSDFEEAFRRFTKERDRDGTFLAWAGIVDAIVYGAASLKSLDPWFSALQRMCRDGRAAPSAEAEARVTSAMIKAVSLRRPRTVDMEMWAERAMRLAESTLELPPKFTSLLNVAYYRFHSGDFQTTGLLLESLRDMVGRPEISPLSRLSLSWLEAAYANANGLHERCLDIVTDGIELADATGVHLMDCLLSGHGALSCMHKGDAGTTRRFLRKMMPSLTAGRPWEASFCHLLAGWDALQRRDQAQALFHSQRGLAVCEEVGNPWTEAMAHLQRAFVLHEGGRCDEAAPHVLQARRIGEESGMHFLRFVCLLAEGDLALVRGDEKSGLSALRQGLRLGWDRGYVDTYIWRPGLLERIAAKALEKGIETEYVRDLIRRNALLPDTGVPDGGRWPWPLKVYALGGFDVLKDEKPLAFSRKVQHKPLLMLKALVALGGKAVPEENVTDILWPDAEGDLQHQSFATTLRRLRTLLGDERAVSLREGRVTLEPRSCWVDVFAFEALLARIDAAFPETEAGSEGTLPADLAAKAIALYRGPFLAGEASHPWVVAMRERLRSKFLRTVGFLGRRLEREGKWAEAEFCYKKGLEVDDLAEEFHRRLMVCLRSVGHTAEALAAYDRCRKTLWTVLGISPSPETEAVARTLRPA